MVTYHPAGEEHHHKTKDEKDNTNVLLEREREIALSSIHIRKGHLQTMTMQCVHLPREQIHLLVLNRRPLQSPTSKGSTGIIHTDKSEWQLHMYITLYVTCTGQKAVTTMDER